MTSMDLLSTTRRFGIRFGINIGFESTAPYLTVT